MTRQILSAAPKYNPNTITTLTKHKAKEPKELFKYRRLFRSDGSDI